ncbi:MAG: TRAM domain-containing protein [Armatimonadota bacterium]
MGLRIFGLIFSTIFALGCALIGSALSRGYLTLAIFTKDKTVGGYPFPQFPLLATLAFAILGALLGFLIGSALFRQMSDVGKNLRRIPAEDKIASTFGTLISLVPAFIIAAAIFPLFQDRMVLLAVVLLEFVLVVWLGNVIALSMKEEIKFLMPGLAAARSAVGSADAGAGVTVKLLDTNVVIDGRIYDICRSGFLQGTIYIPGFVLEELQHIADSADALRRNRGRRGLDILHQMQNELDPSLQVLDRYKATFAPGDGVDIKLVKLAKGMGNADIITNDFNLNKVAKLHGVRVLNVNELANAVKPVVLPGEEMHVNIVREGKEYNQGVGYLDDGTMVVVENGKKMLGDTVPVSVSSVLQTVAGKMIFAELKYEDKPEEESDEHNSYYPGRGNRR